MAEEQPPEPQLEVTFTDRNGMSATILAPEACTLRKLICHLEERDGAEFLACCGAALRGQEQRWFRTIALLIAKEGGEIRLAKEVVARFPAGDYTIEHSEDLRTHEVVLRLVPADPDITRIEVRI